MKKIFQIPWHPNRLDIYRLKIPHHPQNTHVFSSYDIFLSSNYINNKNCEQHRSLRGPWRPKIEPTILTTNGLLSHEQNKMFPRDKIPNPTNIYSSKEHLTTRWRDARANGRARLGREVKPRPAAIAARPARRTALEGVFNYAEGVLTAVVCTPDNFNIDGGDKFSADVEKTNPTRWRKGWIRDDGTDWNLLWPRSLVCVGDIGFGGELVGRTRIKKFWRKKYRRLTEGGSLVVDLAKFV